MEVQILALSDPVFIIKGLGDAVLGNFVLFC